MMPAVGMQVKFVFFDKPEVMRRVAEKRRRGMMRTGGLIKTIAERSMKKARRKRWDELTSEERKRYGRIIKSGPRKGQLVRKPKVKLPFKSAEKDKPPRYRTQQLKNRIRFGYDQAKDDVVIGAEWGTSKDARNADMLEHAGDRVLPGFGGAPVLMHFQGNPFMVPARNEAKAKVPELFKG